MSLAAMWAMHAINENDRRAWDKALREANHDFHRSWRRQSFAGKDGYLRSAIRSASTEPITSRFGWQGYEKNKRADTAYKRLYNIRRVVYARAFLDLMGLDMLLIAQNPKAAAELDNALADAQNGKGLKVTKTQVDMLRALLDHSWRRTWLLYRPEVAREVPQGHRWYDPTARTIEFDPEHLDRESNLDQVVDRVANAIYQKMQSYGSGAWVDNVIPSPLYYRKACSELNMFSPVERLKGEDIINMNWAGFQDFYVR